MTRHEQIRKEILLQLYACRPLALTAERICRDARKEGYDYTVAEILRETQFLLDEGLAVEFMARGTTERLSRISAEGIRHYERQYQS
jgi:hypothetical protein